MYCVFLKKNRYVNWVKMFVLKNILCLSLSIFRIKIK